MVHEKLVRWGVWLGILGVSGVASASHDEMTAHSEPLVMAQHASASHGDPAVSHDLSESERTGGATLDDILTIGGSTLIEEGTPRWVEPRPSSPLELHAWAEAGYLVPVGPVADVSGAYLSMARLQGRLHENDFDAFIQVGADSGDLKLLDARIAWHPHERLYVRAGRFKSPVSAEYLIPAQRILFAHRSLHMAVVPRRNLGAEGEFTVGPEAADVALSVGVFDPAGYELGSEAGQLLTTRALLHTAAGFGAHVAYASWFRGESAPRILGDASPTHDRHLVGALLFEEHGVTSVVEGVIAQHHEDRSDAGEAIGGMASVAYRFPTGFGELDIEPAVALEYLEWAEDRQTSSQVAVNFHPHDWNLTQTIEWEAHHHEGELGHAIYVQLQAGL